MQRVPLHWEAAGRGLLDVESANETQSAQGLGRLEKDSWAADAQAGKSERAQTRMQNPPS